MEMEICDYHQNIVCFLNNHNILMIKTRYCFCDRNFFTIIRNQKILKRQEKKNDGKKWKRGKRICRKSKKWYQR